MVTLRAPTPYWRHQWAEETEQMIGLLRHAARHIAQVRRQHVRNACEKLRRKRERTGRNCEVRMNDIRAPVSSLSQDRQETGRKVKGHLGHGAGIFAPAKGFGRTTSIWSRISRLGRWRMPAVSTRISCPRRARLAATCAATLPPPPPIGRILVAENEDLHLVTSSAPNFASHSP